MVSKQMTILVYHILDGIVNAIYFKYIIFVMCNDYINLTVKMIYCAKKLHNKFKYLLRKLIALLHNTNHYLDEIKYFVV
mgnify:CR=1 FL=1